MRNFISIKTVLFVITVVFLPDLILSISGRDTYLFHLHPVISNIEIASILLVCVCFVIGIINHIINKQWRNLVFSLLIVIVVTLASIEAISYYENQSIKESTEKTIIFLKSKGFDNKIEVSFEDNTEPLFQQYLLKEFSPNDIELVWASAWFGRYEFRINNADKPFYIRLYTLRNEPDELWVHMK